ncbi:ATP-dependent 6-phosphofructokinase [Hydrogenothermus marinus]|uniref:ATP-dependent 6-phosphofructokinase n=1 Tax=Hydrogenothermus marinus TaxID=133270 RepID=A0A3M0B693_9AQUI|nr:ATP-dependent 6-phosphofructokinase [Hydrogenothermus marinus]RMA92567.1 6-phosphofructokinase [Hydrogenothermus marinus]
MKKIAIITSGGDAPGLNAAIRAVVRTANYYNIQVIGFKRGLKGLIENEFIPLDARVVSGFLDKGGTFLLTARENRFYQYEYRKIAIENLKKHNIDALFVIGGNGSFQAANLLVKEFNFPVIGIPKTIDNDTYGTDYTIGFDTCINTNVEAIEKIKDTTMSHERIFIVEVMGRKSGFIALETGIATGADVILIPEYPFPLHVIVDTIIEGKKRGKNFFVIILAEGVAKAQELAPLVERELSKHGNFGEVRYSVLGYIQRGGSPSAYDRLIASRFGVFAVEHYIKGNINFMVALEKGEILAKPLNVSFGKIKKPDLKQFEVANILST